MSLARSIKLFVVLIALLIISPNLVNAATVHGKIYDFSLKLVEGARIEVNTTPNQHHIANDGAYSLNIPKGFYTIKAEFYENNILVASDKENITINQEGDYVIDFILFPNFEEEDDILRIPELIIPESNEFDSESSILGRLFVVLMLIALIVVFIVIIKGKKEEYKEVKSSKSEAGSRLEADKLEENKELNDIIKLIEKEGGRTTQKEIRKQIPLSEAKISLMLAELEHKGIIQKIKKGRGNIIILK